MLTVKNIIVGGGRLYVASGGAALPTFNASGASVKSDFEDSAVWREVGFTSDGVEIAYEPTYTDVMVDQYKDAARLFLESETFNVNTTLDEATLVNLAVAWGRADTNLDAAFDSDGSTATRFTLGVGADCPEEYAVAIVGPASGCPVDSPAVERVYYAPRVVSVTGSTHSLSRTGPTVFPVSFRVLPLDTRAAGEEYGEILDRPIAGP